MSKDYTFNPGDFVVYPAHGVGQIKDISKTSIGGQEMELIAINFDKDKLTLKLPLLNAKRTGLRQIVSANEMNDVMSVLKGKNKVRRAQWSKRSQEYTAKINSGDVIAIAEVLRDLYKDPAKGEQTYSERQVYEQAMSRLAPEFATFQNIKEEEAAAQIEKVLLTKEAIRFK